MIRYVPTSLFTSPAQTLVNAVNTAGVMGKGIALEFKKRYPKMFERYKGFCNDRQLKVGTLYLYHSPNKWVLNFPTKEHWRGPSRIEWIDTGLRKFVESYQARGITSIAFPQLGCGNGGLAWEDVRPLMEQRLKELPIPVYIHIHQTVPGFIPEHEEPQEIQEYTRPRRDIEFTEFLSDLLSHGVCELGRDEQDAETPPVVYLGLPASDHCMEFREDELGDFWYRLRHRGALRYDEYPSSLRSFPALLTEKLLMLPYIRRTCLIDETNRPHEAVRYAPLPRSQSSAHPTAALTPTD